MDYVKTQYIKLKVYLKRHWLCKLNWLLRWDWDQLLHVWLKGCWLCGKMHTGWLHGLLHTGWLAWWIHTGWLHCRWYWLLCAAVAWAFRPWADGDHLLLGVRVRWSIKALGLGLKFTRSITSLIRRRVILLGKCLLTAQVLRNCWNWLLH